MDNVDSDLEEGEILDDSPPSPDINKRKELPQRYIVKDNKTPLHKHKKGCRHAIRRHAKKLSKLKKTPAKKKNSPKFYHKSAYSSDKYKMFDRHNHSGDLKPVLSKDSCFSQNSLKSEFKGSLKSASPFKKLSTNVNKPKSLKIPFPKQNFKTSENDLATSEISSAKMLKDNVDNSLENSKSTNSECLIKKSDSNESLIDLGENSDESIIELSTPVPETPLIDLTKSPDNTTNVIELNSNDNVKNLGNAISSNPLLKKEEESEDEEELRRIALATCAKRKVLRDSTNTNQNVVNVCSVPVPDLPYVNNVQISHKDTNHSTTDNYEVVDMEVDEEGQDSSETVQTLANEKSESAENLFIIDNNPSANFHENKSILETQAANNSDDDDFETNILRAELLNNMFRKKLLEENSKQSGVAVHEKRVPVWQLKKQSANYQKSNLQFCYKRLKSAKHFLRKGSVNKIVNINKNNHHISRNNNNNSISNNKPPLPVKESKPSERLIITVNEESSDDSDNSDEETNAVSENPVDSIVALISDCRQKSESSVETKEAKDIPCLSVPKAVSCLSKAQQEEYNSLMKILAKKEKLPSAERKVSTKNGSIHSPLDDLKKLEGKLVVLRGAVRNKKESMSRLSEEVNSKKLQYMKAKLTAQHLKEQLVAAEKIRKAKLLEWSKTCDNLKLMKKSVSDLEGKMDEVQNLCSKLGSSLQGQSYQLPNLSSGNEQS